MIEMGKTYRTRAGDAVRLYATDCGGYYPVHGAIKDGGNWIHAVWSKDGGYCVTTTVALKRDLIESDPHGILPRHRELLASVYEEMDYVNAAHGLRDSALSVSEMRFDFQAALIALARQDREKGE